MVFPFAAFHSWFRNPIRRISHSLGVSDDRIYKCTWAECGKAFRHADNLKVHYRKHTNEKPFKCVHCDFSCRQQNALNCHVRKHHPSPGVHDVTNGNELFPLTSSDDSEQTLIMADAMDSSQSEDSMKGYSTHEFMMGWNEAANSNNHYPGLDDVFNTVDDINLDEFVWIPEELDKTLAILTLDGIKKRRRGRPRLDEIGAESAMVRRKRMAKMRYDDKTPPWTSPEGMLPQPQMHQQPHQQQQQQQQQQSLQPPHQYGDRSYPYKEKRPTKRLLDPDRLRNDPNGSRKGDVTVYDFNSDDEQDQQQHHQHQQQQQQQQHHHHQHQQQQQQQHHQLHNDYNSNMMMHHYPYDPTNMNMKMESNPVMQMDHQGNKLLSDALSSPLGRLDNHVMETTKNSMMALGHPMAYNTPPEHQDISASIPSIMPEVSAQATCPTSMPTCQDTLPTCPTSLPACQNSLSTCQNSMATCQNSMSTCANSLPTCPSSLPTCSSSLPSCSNGLPDDAQIFVDAAASDTDLFGDAKPEEGDSEIIDRQLLQKYLEDTSMEDFERDLIKNEKPSKSGEFDQYMGGGATGVVPEAPVPPPIVVEAPSSIPSSTGHSNDQWKNTDPKSNEISSVHSSWSDTTINPETSVATAPAENSMYDQNSMMASPMVTKSEYQPPSVPDHHGTTSDYNSTMAVYDRMPGSVLPAYSAASDISTARPSTAFEQRESLTSAFESREPLNATFEPREPLSATFEPREPLSATFEPREPLSTTFESREPLSATFEPREPLSATFEPREPLSATFEPREPLSTSFEQREPLYGQSSVYPTPTPPICSSASSSIVDPYTGLQLTPVTSRPLENPLSSLAMSTAKYLESEMSKTRVYSQQGWTLQETQSLRLTHSLLHGRDNWENPARPPSAYSYLGEREPYASSAANRSLPSHYFGPGQPSVHPEALDKAQYDRYDMANYLNARHPSIGQPSAFGYDRQLLGASSKPYDTYRQPPLPDYHRPLGHHAPAPDLYSSNLDKYFYPRDAMYGPPRVGAIAPENPFLSQAPSVQAGFPPRDYARDYARDYQRGAMYGQPSAYPLMDNAKYPDAGHDFFMPRPTSGPVQDPYRPMLYNMMNRYYE